MQLDVAICYVQRVIGGTLRRKYEHKNNADYFIYQVGQSEVDISSGVDLMALRSTLAFQQQK